MIVYLKCKPTQPNHGTNQNLRIQFLKQIIVYKLSFLSFFLLFSDKRGGLQVQGTRTWTISCGIKFQLYKHVIDRFLSILLLFVSSDQAEGARTKGNSWIMCYLQIYYIIEFVTNFLPFIFKTKKLWFPNSPAFILYIFSLS